MNHRIFISYRRDGGDITAKLISEALKNRGYHTFYDFDALKGWLFRHPDAKRTDRQYRRGLGTSPKCTG